MAGSPVQFDTQMVFDIIERVAMGETLREIFAKGRGLPTMQTFKRWIANDPALAKAFTAALQVSASSLEEEALEMGRKLRGQRDKDSVQVRATEVAMNQLRWSASRRDPQRYGERGNQQVVVPIQINTTLDLGSEVAGGTLTHPNIYELTAQVTAGPPEEKPPKPPPHREPYIAPGKRKLTLTPRIPKETTNAR